MSKALAFWIVWLIVLIFGGFVGYTYAGVGYAHYGLGMDFAVMFLIFLLGWQVFGFPIQ